RGGSLLLLDAVEKLPARVTELRLPAGVTELKLQAISTGASSGLFDFEADGDEQAQEIRDWVDRHLRQDDRFRHATFVVDFLRAGNEADFVRNREQLLAMNRWRQMRQPSVAVPTQNTQTSVQACKQD